MNGSLPVVLVPGMLCDGALWDGVRHVFTGPVEDVVPDASSIDGMARQVLAAVDGPFVLVGLSLGAIVGFEVCRRAPDRVAAFAALSTNAHAPRTQQLAAWSAADREVAMGRFDRLVTESVLPGMFGTTRPEPALADSFRAMAHRVGPDRYRAQLAAQATRTDALPALATHPGPVLVLCGDRDALCPPSFHTAIAETAPRARLVRLPGAGHLTPMEEPAATAQALRAWLMDSSIPYPTGRTPLHR